MIQIRKVLGAAPSDSDAVVAFRKALLNDFDRRKRDLPWRRDRTPYRVLVSEFMLQQTRVDTVLGYYSRWMELFPTVEDLAGAEEHDVLQAWKGLGYYSRARRLHGAAKVIREHWAGRVPSTAEELRSLPGVGAYTAGAVASIAFGRVEAAVDGNVRRVFARLADAPAPTDRELWGWAEVVLDPDRPGDFNESLMELGATICAPRKPDCEACPVAEFCVARSEGTVLMRPEKRKRKPVPSTTFATLVARRSDGALLVLKRDAEGMLAGMWEFPTVDVGDRVNGDAIVLAAREKGEELGLRLGAVSAELDGVRHIYSHLKATYRGVVLPVLEGAVPETSELRWLKPQEMSQVPLSVAQGKIAALVGASD